MALNIKKSSLQRIYEFALRHIRNQGVKSVESPTGACVYRGPNGVKCVVGAMLTDEQMIEFGIENSSSVDGTARLAFQKLVGPDRTKKKIPLLVALQHAHDGAHGFGMGGQTFLEVFEERMQKVAEQFGLRYAGPGTTLRT